MKLYVLIVFAMILTACSGIDSKVDKGQFRSGLPEWVLNPDKPGFISVVGFAPKQDWGGRQAQYRVAEMKARQELAQMVRVRVESTNRFSVEERSGEVNRSADIETRMQSSVDLSLDSAQVIEEWTDPKNGNLYIWLVTPNH